MSLNILKKTLIRLLVIFISISLSLTNPAYPLPQDIEVKEGSAEISVKDNTMTITAESGTILDYGSFNIAENENLIINLPGADSSILNRVTGPSKSNIFGDIDCAKGLFILVNTNGIFVAQSSNISAGSVILSTRDITNDDFLNGNYLFEKISKDQLDRLLENAGTITISDGGFGVLIAGAIKNEGIITARLGKIELVSGDAVKLGISNNSLISVAIVKEVASEIIDAEGNPITDQINNTGTISADGGIVTLRAGSLPDIFERIINLEGEIRAAKVDSSDGKISLVADGDVRLNSKMKASLIEVGTLDEAIGGEVSLEGGYLKADGSILNAEKVKFLGPQIQNLYGDMTIVNFECLVPDKRIVFEADKTYTFLGDLKLQGDYGQHIRLLSSEKGSRWSVDLSDADYDITYTWVEDSNNLGDDKIMMYESTNRGNCVNWDPTGYWVGSVDNLWSTVGNWTGFGGAAPGAGDDVIFDAANSQNNISIVDGAFGGTINSLDIDGYTGTITLGMDLDVTTTYDQNSGTFNETTDWADTGPATQYYLTAGTFNAPTGGTYRGPANATNAAVRVENATDVQNIDTNAGTLAGNYVQLSDIDLVGIANFDPIGQAGTEFTGTYNANGYALDNLTINRSATTQVGLFGDVSNTADIRNLTLNTVDVSGGQHTGILAGRNAGTIANCDVTGGTYAISNTTGGGLVGYNSGDISDCTTAIDITLGARSQIGGLIGWNIGNVSNCSTTGDVTSTGDSIGGLIGGNGGGTVSDCNAQGDIDADDQVGGLIGWAVAGTIQDSYATGSVTGNTDVGGLVGQNSATLDNCYAQTGLITVTGDSGGGLIGRNDTFGANVPSVDNCDAYGDINGGTEIGAFVGYNDGAITGSTAEGAATGTANVGGFAGENDTNGVITNCTASGDISGANGAFAGLDNGTLTNSYHTSQLANNTQNTVNERDLPPTINPLENISKISLESEWVKIHGDGIPAIAGIANIGTMIIEIEGFYKQSLEARTPENHKLKA